MKYSIVFRVRPFRWMFRRDWYGTSRWGLPEQEYGGKCYLIDFGSFTFGIRGEKK